MSSYISLTVLALFAVHFWTVNGLVSVVKMVVVNRDDAEWSSPVDELAMTIARDSEHAPQIFEIGQTKSTCEMIGNIDRARMQSDFVLVLKKSTSEKLDCDPEMGLLNFAFATFTPLSSFDATSEFSATLSFSANESSDGTIHVTSVRNLMNLVFERQMKIPFSQIPDEYPHIAEKRQRIGRRIYLAIISILMLVLCSLLVIMFMGSLKRYNDRTKKKDQKPKKSTDVVLPEKSIKAMKENSKSERSSKEKGEEKKPLLGGDSNLKTADQGPSLILNSKKERTARSDNSKDPTMDKSQKNEMKTNEMSEKSEKSEKTKKSEKSEKDEKDETKKSKEK